MTDVKDDVDLSEALPEADSGAEKARFRRAHQVLLAFAGGALAIWLLTGFYQVQPGQVAIQERLGQYLTNPEGKVIQIEHGLHYHLPWPIDRVSVVSLQQIYNMPVKMFNTSPAQYADFKLTLMHAGYPEQVINSVFDPYLISGDKSVAHVEMSVQFRINDPVAWLTSISHEYQTVYDPAAQGDMRNSFFEDLAQEAMIRQVAQMELQKVVGEGRNEMALGIKDGMDKAMFVPDPADATGEGKTSLGVDIRSVAISVARVPDRVKDAYDNLIAQRENAQTSRINAEAAAKGYATQAEADVNTLITNAQSDKYATIQAAQGEVDRFKQVLAQYNKAPELTRLRLFTDAATTVTQAAKRIVYANPGEKLLLTVDPPQYDANQVQGQAGR